MGGKRLDRVKPGPKPRALIERLFDHIAGPWGGDVGPDDCWPFTAAWRSAWGYGMIQAGGRGSRAALAHREMLRASITNFDDALVVRHRCDNPICCNPAHLEQGTQRDNVRDQILRMRRRLRRGKSGRFDVFRQPTEEDYET